jgi:lysophospholipase L1-like esterase
MRNLLILAGVSAAAFYWWKSRIPKCPRTIAALGDSITLGNYAAYLQEQLPGCRFNVFGYSGKGSGFIADQVPGLLRTNPDDVIVLAGVNDLASQRNLDQIDRNLDRIYSEIRGAGKRVIAVGILPWAGNKAGTDKIEETKEINRRIRENRKVDIFVDTSSLGDSDGKLKEGFSIDGLHPNAKGKKALAHLIIQAAY